MLIVEVKSLMYKLIINSVDVHSVGYDNGSKTLEVCYHTNETHRYIGVPFVIYQRLIIAKNTDVYIQKRVVNRYDLIKEWLTLDEKR